MQLSEGFEGEPYVDTPLDHLSSIKETHFCPFGAPLFAIVWGDRASIQQACCNHWECPVCGLLLAERARRRIIHGAEILSVCNTLFFWTLTCRGKEVSLAEAEENYYAWTHTLLDNAHKKAKRAGLSFVYVQVTERQKKTRIHPHSHLITTFCPSDGVVTLDQGGRRVIVSSWFSRANESAGLGSQHRITQIDSALAVAHYVAKYLDKQTMIDTWPAHWRRVRYAREWPKLPEPTPDYCLPLLSRRDWEELDRTPYRFTTPNVGVYEYARHRCASVCC